MCWLNVTTSWDGDADMPWIGGDGNPIAFSKWGEGQGPRAADGHKRLGDRAVIKMNEDVNAESTSVWADWTHFGAKGFYTEKVSHAVCQPVECADGDTADSSNQLAHAPAPKKD
jgi:hypothetical protein